MNRIEDQLRNALRRPEAPDGFEARVLARVRRETAPRRGWRPKLLAVAASVLLVLIPLGWMQHRRVEARRQAEAEKARQQLILALQISSRQLNYAFQKLQPEPEATP